MRYRVFILLLCGVVTAGDVFAAAAMQRRLQQQKMQQEQLQQQAYQQAYQQAAAQKQAQEMAVYQQAMAQRQAMMQQAAYQKAAVEYAGYKQAMQQAVLKRNAELQAVQSVKEAMAQRQAQQAAVQQAIAQRQVQEVTLYKQAVAQKQMAEVVAYKQGIEVRNAAQQQVQGQVNQQVREYAQYLSARKAALSQQAMVMQQSAVGQKLIEGATIQQVNNQRAQAIAQTKVASEAVAKSALGQRLATDVMAPSRRGSSQLVRDDLLMQDDTVVRIQDLWSALDKSSEAWAQIVDKEAKLLTVSEYIDRFGKLKVRITKDPGYYVGLIDAFAKDLPGFLSAPFMNVLSYAAIVEYDFESGANKDDLARQVLGPQQFESNRKRVFGR